jgi:hypothetical protein
VLNQPKDSYQHQEMILLILVVRQIKMEAFAFYQMLWLGEVCLKFQLSMFEQIF